MSDPRPQPQFGEYASPEEQRAARGLPAEETQPAVAPGPTAPYVLPSAPVSDAASDRKPRRWDRIVTFALLAYGLITVFVNGSTYLNAGPMMNEAMAMLGIEGTFTNFEAARTWGLIAALLMAFGWTVTAVLSVRRLRAGKLTWWLPIVGAVVTTFLASVCLVIPMMGDPAFLEYVRQAAGS